MGKNKTIPSEQREIILRVLNFFEEEKKRGLFVIPVDRVLKRTVAATGVCLSTITRLKREREKQIMLQTSDSPNASTSAEPTTSALTATSASSEPTASTSAATSASSVMSQQDLEQSSTQNKLSTMEQLVIKVEPEMYNDDAPHVNDMQQMDTFLTCNRKIKYENMLHHELFIKNDPDSELIDDTQVMCASSDGVSLHIKEEPAADVGYDEPAPLLVTRLLPATRLHLIGPCTGYVRLTDIMSPAKPAAQQECLRCCIPVYRLTTSDLTIPVPLKEEVEESVSQSKFSSIPSVHKQQVVPSGLSTDDVCVSGNSDCTRQVNAKEHVKCTASGNTNQCDVRDECFSEKNDLEMHNCTDTVKKLYQCDKCGKTLSQSKYIHIHNLIHTGEKPHKCNICNKSFRSKCSINRHARTHTGVKPYKCDMCDKTFRFSSCLRTHIRTHTGEKPHKCDKCFKSFSELGALKRHIRIHTGEKPYKCDICDKSFTQSSNLFTHMKKMNHGVKKTS